MKNLNHLDLSHDEIGELGILEIINELNNLGNSSIETLDLSGNCLGKSQPYFTKLLEPLIKYFTMSRVITLKLGFNNLRGPVESLLQCFIEMNQLKELDLQSNHLGYSYGPRKDKKPAPISILADVIIKAPFIKRINISNNGMDA